MATLRLTNTDETRIKDIQEKLKISQTDILKSGIDVLEKISNKELSYEEYLQLIETIREKVKND